MEAAYEAARYRDAEEAYDRAVADGASPSTDAALLRARLYLKRDDSGAIDFLLSHEPRRASAQQRTLWNLYLAMGYARLRAFEAADRHFKAGEAATSDRALKAEIAIQRSRRFLLEGNFDAAEEQCQRATADRTLRGRVRSQLLLSFIRSHQERYEEQLRIVLTVLKVLHSRRSEMQEEWYTATHAAAVLAREIPVADACEAACRAVDADEDWSSDFAVSRFQALKAVAWCRAQNGDHLGCFRYLRKAEAVAPTAVWTTMVHLDRAYFARSLGEEQWALNEFSAAIELAAPIQWEECAGEERVALLLLAELSATFDRRRSEYYIARYRNLRRLRSNLQLYAFDHRLEALAAAVEGIVNFAGGDTANGERLLREAWGIFERIRYEWRAGQSALRLYEITGKKRWLHLAEEKAEAYPRSALAKEVRRAHTSTGPKFTPAQARILAMLCEGQSTEQMARHLRRSEHTVRNHIKAIFKSLGVTSRAALVAAATRHGLVK